MWLTWLLVAHCRSVLGDYNENNQKIREQRRHKKKNGNIQNGCGNFGNIVKNLDLSMKTNGIMLSWRDTSKMKK